MVFGEEYFGRGDLDHNSYLSFVTNDALGQDFLNASKSFAYWIKDRCGLGDAMECVTCIRAYLHILYVTSESSVVAFQ